MFEFLSWLPAAPYRGQPQVIAIILIALGVYFYCLGPLRVRLRLGPPVPRWRVYCALGAGFVVFLSEGTALHTLSEVYLFSAHMVQHALLTLFMAPMFILAIPGWLADWWADLPVIGPITRFLTRPLVAFAAYNGIYSLWHFPVFYQAPLLLHWLHVIQHITMATTALMMWWPLLSPSVKLPRLSYGGQLVYAFGMVLAQLPVFAPITFASAPIYGFYADAPRVWGISPLEDQQWAGIIMKLTSMAILLLVIGIAFFRWAKQDGQDAPVASYEEQTDGRSA